MTTTTLIAGSVGHGRRGNHRHPILASSLEDMYFPMVALDVLEPRGHGSDGADGMAIDAPAARMLAVAA
jgi:hypothetical protein